MAHLRRGCVGTSRLRSEFVDARVRPSLGQFSRSRTNLGKMAQTVALPPPCTAIVHRDEVRLCHEKRIYVVAPSRKELRASGKVPVTFRIKYKCKFGQELCIVGDDEALGAWNMQNAIPLKWSDGNIWVGCVELIERQKVQYKYVVRNGDMSIERWQEGNNVVLEVPDLEHQDGEEACRLEVQDFWCQSVQLATSLLAGHSYHYTFNSPGATPYSSVWDYALEDESVHSPTNQVTVSPKFPATESCSSGDVPDLTCSQECHLQEDCLLLRKNGGKDVQRVQEADAGTKFDIGGGAADSLSTNRNRFYNIINIGRGDEVNANAMADEYVAVKFDEILECLRSLSATGGEAQALGSDRRSLEAVEEQPRHIKFKYEDDEILKAAEEVGFFQKQNQTLHQDGTPFPGTMVQLEDAVAKLEELSTLSMVNPVEVVGSYSSTSVDVTRSIVPEVAINKRLNTVRVQKSNGEHPEGQAPQNEGSSTDSPSEGKTVAKKEFKGFGNLQAKARRESRIRGSRGNRAKKAQMVNNIVPSFPTHALQVSTGRRVGLETKAAGIPDTSAKRADVISSAIKVHSSRPIPAPLPKASICRAPVGPVRLQLDGVEVIDISGHSMPWWPSFCSTVTGQVRSSDETAEHVLGGSTGGEGGVDNPGGGRVPFNSGPPIPDCEDRMSVHMQQLRELKQMSIATVHHAMQHCYELQKQLWDPADPRLLAADRQLAAAANQLATVLGSS